MPNLLRAKHWYSPSYSSGRPPLRKSITRVPDRLLIDTRGSLAMLKNLLLRVQWKLYRVGATKSSREGSGLPALGQNLRALDWDLGCNHSSRPTGPRLAAQQDLLRHLIKCWVLGPTQVSF